MEGLECLFAEGITRCQWHEALHRVLRAMRTLPHGKEMTSPYDKIFKIKQYENSDAMTEDDGLYFVYRPEMREERVIGPCRVISKQQHEWILKTNEGRIVRAAKCRIMEAEEDNTEEDANEEEAEEVLHPIVNAVQASKTEIERGDFTEPKEKELKKWQQYNVYTVVSRKSRQYGSICGRQNQTEQNYREIKYRSGAHRPC
eukprot:Platyproteum_vivax@DN7413_c0_g1_i3.p1